MTERLLFSGGITAEGRRIRGTVRYAGVQKPRGGELIEIDPAAIVKADTSLLVGRWDHDPARQLGTLKNGTVRLSRTDQGMDYEIDVPDTTYGNDLLALAKRGDVAESSFEIEGVRSQFSTHPKTGERIRRIIHVDRLTDVSAVTDGFWPSSAEAFSKETEVADKPEVEAPASASQEETKEPKVQQFTAAPEPQKDDKSDIYRRAEHFAETQDLRDLETSMSNLLAYGELTETQSETYAAMADVYERRKRAVKERDSSAEARRMAFELITGKGPKAPANVEVFDSEDYSQAFSQYLRTGDGRVLEQFAQSIAGSGAEGGYTVPTEFRQKIVETMVAYGGVANVAETITTADGRDLSWPSNDDTSNSAVIATEGAAAASGGADITFGQISLSSYSYDATGASNVPLLVSKELIQDSAFDIEGFVSRKLGERLGRKMAADFATADGSSKPKGLFAKSADTMTATTMLAALQEHFFQVDQAYRDGGNASWLLSDTTLAKIFASVDLNGRPLFIPSADASGAGRPAGLLLGYPARLDQGAGDNVAFGDFRQGFIVRYVRGVQVDVDPYTNIKSRQLAFHAWARADSDVQDSAAYSVSDYSGVSADTTA